MARPPAEKVPRSKPNSSAVIASFIDTSFQHQNLPPLRGPEDSLRDGKENNNSNAKKIKDAAASADSPDHMAFQNIGDLLRHIPRVYNVVGNKPVENDQEKLIQMVQTLRRIYGICEVLDKSFGNQ